MLCGLFLLIVASACTEEIMSDARGREITVTASIATSGGSDSESANPSGKRKAVLRPTDGTLDLLTRWQEGDQVMLYVKQDGKVYTLDPVPVRNISADGKSCSLVFKLPSAVDAEKAYTLYGLYGIEGMVADTEVLAKSQLTRKSWADGKAMPSPMWFQAAGGPMSLQAHFLHLGTYEVLHVKNTSGKPITFQQWGFDVDVPWYKYEERTPLREDYDPSQYVTEPGDVESDVVTIDNGKTVPILSWYMPSGGNVSNARLLASVDGRQVTSANTKSSTVKIQRGRAYHMYATWDGSELSFDDGEIVTPPDYPVETETFTVNGVSFTMVAVEGGTFWMGAADDDGEADSDERPRHEVTLSSYAIGQTEVTQALWQAVMGSNPSDFQGADHPVEKVSWNDCQEFITKLNALTGRTFRLPTEAEWEYAARGGQNSHGYKYAGSNDIEEVAWYENNAYYVEVRGTRPIAQMKANELGLYDMSGNVYEWCQDWYNSNYYSNSPAVNPCNTSEASYRMRRGGGWYSETEYCRVSDRSFSNPDYRNNNIGLRLALGDTGHSSPLTPGEAIDLGLPSGTKWASCNVGASSPEEYGGYYAWGETEEKESYNWSTYKWMNEGQSSWSQINKYTFADGQTSACWYRDGTFIGDGKTTLDPEDDVAHVKWGGNWRMPTREQIDELISNCSSEWTTLNGVNGWKFTGPNGNSIFLPAADFRDDQSWVYPDLEGGYWSSSLDAEYSYWACDLHFYMGDVSCVAYSRFSGHSVRPVRVQN